MYQIEMLPAAHGDALWIEYGDPAKPHRIVIDGGPAATYERGLRARIGRMLNAGQRRIDLFVITHVDCDHIDGAVIFLQECAAMGVEIDEIWFNAWKHLAAEEPDVYKPLQGEFLGALVNTNREFRARWNTRFRRSAVVVPDDGRLPAFELPGDARLTLLSPRRKQLNRLRAQWAQAVREFTPGDEKAALERLKQRRDYRPPRPVDVFAAKTYGSDRSAPNGSSIAFLLEHDGHSCLFGADAYARVLAESLKQLCQDRQLDRLTVDAVKLPHHGSLGNVNEALLGLLRSEQWLISTNGAIFDHPDLPTVELIAKCSPVKPRILCNYRVESTERLTVRAANRWSVHFPGVGAETAPSGGLRLQLSALPSTQVPTAAARPARRTLKRRSKRKTAKPK